MTCKCDSKWTIASGTLKRDGKAVEQIKSPHTSGDFAQAPKIVVMHYTAGSSARSSANWFKNPGSSASAHVVIARDGTVLQCVSFDKVAWHAGKSRWGSIVGLNRHSIGIELANWGPLKSANGGWQSYSGQRIADPVLAVHRNGNPDGSRTPMGWEPYPEAQIDAAKAVVRALVEKYGIEEIVGHDDIAPVRKHDPGPAFDMTRFRNAVLETRGGGADAAATVQAPNGLNLRSGPGTSFAVVKLLADQTRLELLGEDGIWLEVSSLDANDQPVDTGWVHSHYVRR